MPVPTPALGPMPVCRLADAGEPDVADDAPVPNADAPVSGTDSDTTQRPMLASPLPTSFLPPMPPLRLRKRPSMGRPCHRAPHGARRPRGRPREAAPSARMSTPAVGSASPARVSPGRASCMCERCGRLVRGRHGVHAASARVGASGDRPADARARAGAGGRRACGAAPDARAGRRAPPRRSPRRAAPPAAPPPPDDFAFVGTTEWLDEARGLARVEVNFTDDLVALRAFRDCRALSETPPW